MTGGTGSRVTLVTRQVELASAVTCMLLVAAECGGIIHCCIGAAMTITTGNGSGPGRAGVRAIKGAAVAVNGITGQATGPQRIVVTQATLPGIRAGRRSEITETDRDIAERSVHGTHNGHGVVIMTILASITQCRRMGDMSPCCC